MGYGSRDVERITLKILSSPSRRWHGSVTISDPMTLPQVMAIEEVFGSPEGEGRVMKSVIDRKLLPAILACVEKWDIANMPEAVTVDTFPATPRGESSEFIRWLWNELYKVYIGETEIPNV